MSPLFARILFPLVLVAAPSLSHLLSQPQDPKPAAEAQDPKAGAAAKEAKVRELLEVTGAAQMGKQAMEQMMQAFDSMPNLPEGFAAKFLELAKPEQLVELIVPIYMKHVDTNDLDTLLAFFRTPSGKRWIQAQSPIMKESMEAGQKWGQELAMKVMEELNK
jgi:hypothetical protein